MLQQTKPKRSTKKAASDSGVPSFTAKSKIAVLRMCAWGDLIDCLPMLQTLRALAPKSEIIYIGSEWHGLFLPRHVPYVDRVITVPFEATEQLTWPDKRLAKEYASVLGKEKFDVLIQAHDAGQLGDRIVPLINAKYRIGFSNNDESPLDHKFYYEINQNHVMRLFELLTPWKVTDFHLAADMVVTPDDTTSGLALLDGLAKKQYIVIHPGAGDPRRRWPVKRFAKIAQWLTEQGYPVVVTGSNNEIDIANDLQMYTKNELTIRAGMMTMGNTLAILQNAKMVISNDTGPLYAARALDTPTVGLYAARFFARSCPTFVASNRSVVSAITECPSCGKDVFLTKWPALDQWQRKTENASCLHADSSLVSDIGVAEVQAAIESIL